MNELITSSATGKTYDPVKCVRIVNIRQIMLYLTHDVELLDIYVGTNYKTNTKSLVAVFDRKASKKCWDRWKIHELDWDEE